MTAKNTNDNMALDAILTRTSIRKFTDQTLSKEQTETLLRAGMAAPSACNKQPWRFVVVEEQSMRDSIVAEMSSAAPAAKAPSLLVVCGDATRTLEGEGFDYWVEDCAAVTENILLAAHAMGLGAVWLGIYPKKDRSAAISRLLSLPDDIMPFGMVAVGYPAETHAPKDKWHPEYVHYGKWNDGGNTVATAAGKPWRKVSAADARLDAFTLFRRGAALTVGHPGAMNSMLIGWGEIGTLWGHDTATVYVRQTRFTKHLMEENETFTIEAFPKEYAAAMRYLGSASGRNEDKMAGSGLTVKMMDNGAPAFEEGTIILECRKLATVDYTMDKMHQSVNERWYTNGGDDNNYHTAYAAEITAVWVK